MPRPDPAFCFSLIFPLILARVSRIAQKNSRARPQKIVMTPP
jgi:hypothetical protein